MVVTIDRRALQPDLDELLETSLEVLMIARCLYLLAPIPPLPHVAEKLEQARTILAELGCPALAPLADFGQKILEELHEQQ